MVPGQEAQAGLQAPAGLIVSAAGASENSGTGAVRAAHCFDEAALARWMDGHVESFRGPLRVE